MPSAVCAWCHAGVPEETRRRLRARMSPGQLRCCALMSIASRNGIGAKCAPKVLTDRCRARFGGCWATAHLLLPAHGVPKPRHGAERRPATSPVVRANHPRPTAHGRSSPLQRPPLAGRRSGRPGTRRGRTWRPLGRPSKVGPCAEYSARRAGALTRATALTRPIRPKRPGRLIQPDRRIRPRSPRRRTRRARSPPRTLRPRMPLPGTLLTRTFISRTRPAKTPTGRTQPPRTLPLRSPPPETRPSRMPETRPSRMPETRPSRMRSAGTLTFRTRLPTPIPGAAALSPRPGPAQAPCATPPVSRSARPAVAAPTGVGHRGCCSPR